MKDQARQPVRRCAQPIELVHTDASSRAVVCLHGFTGYPGELALPAKRLYEAGFDVFVPRYPGHGTNGKDFLRSRGADWIGEAKRQIESIQSKYQSISLVGHSMGGAIAVLMASLYPIDRMVLYAPALVLPTLPVKTVKCLSFVIKRKRKEWHSDPSYPFFDDRDEDDDAFLGSEYWSWIYPKQIAELSDISKQAVAALESITSNILVFTGQEDTVIPQAAGTLVLDRAKGQNNWIHLPKATHLIPYDRDEATREEAMERTVLWISG